MPMQPPEFSSELTDELLRRMMGGIDRQEALRVGQGRSEALARGLTGDPFEASLTGAVRAGADESRLGTEADFRYRLADLARQERLIGQGQQFQAGEALKGREFTAGEAERNRAFQERLARLGYDFNRDEEALRFRRGYQGDLFRGGLRLGGGILGGVAGRYLGY